MDCESPPPSTSSDFEKNRKHNTKTSAVYISVRRFTMNVKFSASEPEIPHMDFESPSASSDSEKIANTTRGREGPCIFPSEDSPSMSSCSSARLVKRKRDAVFRGFRIFWLWWLRIFWIGWFRIFCARGFRSLKWRTYHHIFFLIMQFYYFLPWELEKISFS